MLSNHYHMVVSADDGSMSAFFGLLNGLLARAMNCALGRGENFWAPGGVRKSGIFDEAGLWEQLVYCTINPTKDGLVEAPEAWPGLISLPEDVESKTFRFQRPDTFFRSEGEDAMPEWVEFELVRPVELEHMSLEEFQATYRRLLDEAVAEVQQERAAAGKGFLGAELVRQQNPLDAAGDTFPDRDTTPRVVCKDVRRRRGVLRWLSEFRLAHAIAWFFWSRGDRNVIFPAFTNLMRVRYRVRCREPALDCPGQVALAA